MIWDRGYYSSKDDPYTFTHKAVAAAKIAGIVAIGFAALPAVGGAAAGQLGKFLATEKGNALLGIVGAEFNEIFEKTASAASQFFGLSTKEMRSSAYTLLTHEKRAAAYVESLAARVEGYKTETKDAIVSKLQNLIPSFSPIIGAVDMQSVEHINPQQYLDALEKKAAKYDILFNSSFKREQNKIFRNLIEAGRNVNATQQEVDAYLGKSHGTLANALKSAWQRSVEASERSFVKSKHLPGRSLTWGEINNSPHLREQFDAYSHTIGYKGGFNEIHNEVINNLRDLFATSRTQKGNKVHSWNTDIVDELTGLFHSTHSGYSLGADGRIISTAHASNTAKRLVEKAFSHLQLPLIPYKFNVPVRLFKFAQAEHKALIHLGNLGAQSELSKAFKYSIESNKSHGVSLGEHLLILDPDKGIIDTGRKISTYKSRNSAAIQRIAGLRSLDVENYLDNWGEGYRRNWKPDSNSLHDTQRLLFSASPHWLDVDYDPAVGFIGKAKIQEYSPFFAITHGNSMALDVAKIHPDQLAHILKTNPHVTPGDKLLALDRIMIERSRSSENIGEFLQNTLRDKENGKFALFEDVLSSSSDYPFKDYRGLLRNALANAKDPKTLAKAIAEIPDIIFQGPEGFSFLQAATRRADHDRWYSPLHQYNSKLWRAVTSFASEPEQITEVAKEKNGLFGELRQEIEGKTGVSPMFQKLQEGLLSQWVSEASYSILENEEKGGRSIMAHIQDGMKGELDPNSAVGKSIARLGLDEGQTKALLGQVYNGTYVDYNKLRAVLGTLVDPDKLLAETSNPTVKAKIADELRASVEEAMSVVDHTEERKAQLISTIAEHAKLLEKIGGKGAWFPQDMPENPLIQPMHLGIPNDTPSLGEIFENPFKVLREQYGKGFGLGDYVQALVDPDHPLGQFSMATTILMQMPQEIANNIGIGLGQQDRITAARSLLGFYGKRVAPLVGAYAAYQGLNHLAHQADMPGVDDIGANILANANLAGATVKDALGITKASQYLVGLLPGLDQYFHPRSHDEYEDYLFYGDEEVRSGRGWVIGTRGSIHGGKVKYVRPNFYRRWKSHWTEVDNSFSYSPHNPYVKHAQHRKELNNLRDENYLEVNSQGQYGELGYGTFGYGLPIQTSGGGTPVLFGEVGGYPGGAGSTGPGGAHPGGLPIRVNYFHGHSEGSMSLQNLITGASDIFRRQFGLYGTILQRVPFFPTEYDSTARQNPNADHNIIRRMFAGDYGEATGPLGEFLRRFVNYRQQPYDAPSNLINDMPSWLPSGRFSTGNPYLRAPGGEHNLPGEIFEKEFPWTSQLRVRGSNIGLTEKEIIQKWLNPMQPLEGDGAEDIVNFGCVDTETEILTENGWKKYGGFKVGDKILTLNHDTGLSEWHPVDHINSYSVTDEKLVRLESRGHSSLTTKNHKWPILRTYNNNNILSRVTREWTTSEHVGIRNQAIILGAKCSEIPTTPIYSDDFVKLVAWYWTEGSLHGKRAVFIHQSKKVNMPYVLEIRQILTNLFGPESSNMHSNYGSNPPMWREYSTKADFATFALNVPASEELLKVVPNKIASTDFIKQLTEDQLYIFIETSIKGDGKYKTCIGQKEEKALEAIELACILLGKRTNLRLGSPWIYRYKGNERVCNEYILSFNNHCKYNFDQPEPNRKTEVEYTGIVWCPTVKNSTWCARRKGKVFYTGNSEAHLKIQRQLRDQGILVGAEVSIFDKEHNISGTIDAIVRGPTGNEIFDIKTQGAKSWGHTPDKYIDQITAYMAITGLKMAHLAFVNRDDMSQVRIEDYPFDPHRWQNILDKVDRARAVMNQLVAKGTVSKYETYDLLSRIEILARVAPKSQEFRDAVQFAEESGGFGGFEKQRFQAALRTAGKLSEDYNLYPNKYSPKLETHSAMVLGVNKDGSVTTDIGTFKMAGVKWDNQAFAIKDPETIMKEYGIVVGKKHKMTLLEGQWNPELTNDANLPAIFGSANARLINSDYADRDSEARDPLSGRVLFGEPIFGKIAENLLHRDTPILNKFLRTRTATEQLERGEVYGTDDTSWSHMWDTFGGPTLSAIASKNPFEGALMGAAIAGMFITGSKEYKKWAGIAGAVAGGSLATLKSFYDLAHHDEWVPSRVKKRRMHDEYWDLIKFVKFSTIANAAKKKAKRIEGVDIDKLEDAEKRTTVGLGPWAILALNAEKKAMGTMYAFDPDSGSLDEALSAIPDRHKQLARSVILNGSRREKERFYSLLSNPEKRTLGKFIGVDERDLPIRPRMSKYFQKHFLPGPFWKGWDPTVELDDIEDRAAEMEGQKIDRPSRARTERAREHTKNVMIPRMDRGTGFLIGGRLEAITALAGKNLRVRYDIKASDTNVVNVNMHLFEDQTDQLIAEMKKDAWSG